MLSCIPSLINYLIGIVNLTGVWQTGQHEKANAQLPTSLFPRMAKKSSSLALSKTRKFFNLVECVEGIRDRWQCDRFVIENFATDGNNRIYRCNRIGKTLEFD